jgi:hypothetical protein
MGEAVTYRVRVRGQIGPEWSAWFEGFLVSPQADGDTVITGPVHDQAALHGLLARVRDLGLPLLAVETADRAPDSGSARTGET